MMGNDSLNKYLWLLDIIKRAGKITFEEINEQWVRSVYSHGEEIPLRTFHRWRDTIERMFDININCERKGGYYYYIENESELNGTTFQQWLLDSFYMSNLISESRQLKDRILLEYIPSGREHLSTIIEAIRNKIEISIVHQSYRADSPKEYTVQPYCIKLFNQRWYILGMCKEVDSIRTFGLDRIHSIRHLKTTFEFPTDFDAVKYYNECFGIVSDDGTKVETIKLKVYGLQRYYLRSLPLHSSQQEIDSADDYSIFQYQVRPTFDFRQALLSKGSEVEVLEPIAFREEMKNEIQNMKNRYQ
jgi:hypothetical protein